MVKRICKSCGIEFYIKSSEINRGGGKFCSRGCYFKWKNSNASPKNKICLYCGNTFTVKNTSQRFCSKVCSNKGRTSHKSIACATCGKIIEVTKSKFSRKKYCSRACKDKALFKYGEFCQVEGCHNKHYVGGYCQKHHQRILIHGNFNIVKNRPALNNDYFKTISFRSAYILGLLITDGCIHNNRRRIEFTSTDLELVEYIRQQLGSDKQIINRKPTSRGKPLFTLRVASKTMVEDLKQFGIVPRKTHIVVYPNIPESYNIDFIRGTLDGDGCITIRHDKKCNKRRIALIWVGTYGLLKGIAEKLHKLCDVRYREPKKRNEGSYSLAYQDVNECLKICRFIYDKACMKLNRKYQKAIIYFGESF